MANPSPKKGVIEKKLRRQNMSLIGIDEVGRGCLAGPVVAACVAINYEKLAQLSEKQKLLVRDSKKLSAKQRQTVLEFLKPICLEMHYASSSVEEIEQNGIVGGTFLAMRRSLASCKSSYDMLLVDGNQKVTGYQGKQMTVVGGDSLCFAIAAASILAKEVRDTYMKLDAAQEYPEYGFDKHVGYGTKIHMDALGTHGICPLHRRNFAPVSKICLQQNLPLSR